MKTLLILLTALSLFGSDYAAMKESFDKGDINRAITFARTNAMKGNISAMYDLGLLYYAKGDANKAKTWLERSVKNDGKGDLAVSLLMFTQSKNRGGYKKVTESLINVPKGEIRDALMAVSKDLAANRHDASAESYLVLGDLFSSDPIVHPDMRIALFLTNQAAEKGSVKAMEMMGDANWRSSYTNGSLLLAPQTGNSIEVAFKYYQSATSLGNLDAMAKMGKLYIVAPWIYNNAPRGVQLIMESANGGSKLGAMMAGELYASGYGVKGDSQQALQWYLKATDICDTNKLLANLYSRGEEAQKYASAYKTCTEEGSSKRRYHILFEEF